jgi:hypothetical protein
MAHSRSLRIAALAELAVPLLLFSVLAWGYGGSSEVGWQEARRLDAVTRGGQGAELGFLSSSPAYEAVLGVWLSVRREAAWARRLSLFVGLIAIATVWAAGKALFGGAEGVVAATLLALNPLFYRHTHSVSSQPFFWAAALASTALWRSALSRGGVHRWVAYLVTAALALYAGSLGVALVGVQVAMSVWRVLAPTRRDRPIRRPILEVVGAAVLLAGLAVPRVLTAMGSPGPALAPGEKVTGVTLDVLDQAYRELAGGAGFAATSLGVLAVIGLVTSVRKRVVRSRGVGRVIVDKRRRRPALCLFWTILVGILVASLLTVPFARSLRSVHLQGLLPFFLMLSARGIVEAAALIRRLTRTLLGLTVPASALGVALSVALLASASLDSIRRQRVDASVAGGWRHVGERLAACLTLGGDAIVLPSEAGPAIRWNTPALAAASFVEARPAAVGPTTICLIATVDGLPSPPEGLLEACDQRLQEVDRYLFPGRTGFFSLRASTGLASVARQLLAAQDRLQDDAASPEALRDLADACADGGAMEEARRALRRIMDSDQATAEDLVFLGVVDERLGLPAQALEHYGAALEREPQIALAHARVGVILASRGDAKAAKEHLELALELQPTDSEALAALTELLSVEGSGVPPAQLSAELDHLRPDVPMNRAFGVRFEVLGYTPADTAVAPGEPFDLTYYIRCLRPLPMGHQVRHRLVGGGLRVSFQSVDSADSASLAGARPGETVRVRCSLGVEWSTSGASGRLELGLARPDGSLLPVAGYGSAWLPVTELRAATAEFGEPVEVVAGQDLDRRTGFALPDGLSVSPGGAWKEFVLGPGRFRLRVEARGMPAAGEWPVMSMEIDGTEKRRVTVSTNTWAEYSCSVGEGGRRVRVGLRFLNDHYDAVTGEDRNLIVSNIKLVEETTLLTLAPVD